jgi:hypothetical protein
MHRTIAGTLMALGLGLAGFGLGGVLGASLLTRPADGLAGSTTAALAALVGGVLGLLLGAGLGGRLARGRLVAGAVIGLLAGAAGMGLLAARGSEAPEATSGAEAGPAAERAESETRETGTPPPPVGDPDSLIGLVLAPPESLPQFETLEHAYEERAVAVYGIRGPWYLVGRPGGGRSWLDARVTGRFFPLDELLVDRLNYLTTAWDRSVRATPGLNAPAQQLALPAGSGEEVPADVLESRRAGGTLWLRVSVLGKSPCDGGQAPPVLATGWIPAWGAGGKPAAWFFSRGC